MQTCVRSSALLVLIVLALLAMPVLAAPVVYLAGDSTVVSYASGNYPQQGWGGRIRDYFTSGVTFNNRAVGGTSSKSYVDEGRLSAILGIIKPGDYLFIQFGHNDGYSDPRLHTDPYTTYKTYLAMYIDLPRQYGAIPVLVTPMGRRRYDSSGKFINDFVDRAAAMKQLAAEKSVPLIDLNASSIAYYNGVGAATTADVFLWLPPNQYPRFPNGVSDITHFQEYGAGQLARLVVQGIYAAGLAIRNQIAAVNYPAEAGILTGAGTVRARSYAGSQGKGYVDFPASGGALTLNSVLGKGGGLTTIRIRYANGSAAARIGQLVVNGVATAISFAPSGSWSTWTTKDVTVLLQSGATNTLSLRSTGADLANIDGISLP